MSEKILFVDDDSAILQGYKRMLRRDFEFDTAADAVEGLASLAHNGPYAVVVADMRMPGMDGVQFLSKVTLKFPGVIRIMLTGNADLQTAMRAVNEGNIFRFLTKPCDKELLTQTLNAALVQYRLAAFKEQHLPVSHSHRPGPRGKSDVGASFQDAEQHVRELLGNNAVTRLPALDNGIYVGKTIWESSDYLVQRIAATIAIAHPKDLFVELPAIGEIVRIEYSTGTVTTKELGL